MSSHCEPQVLGDATEQDIIPGALRRSVRLAILTNMIPPYRQPVLLCLAERYAHMRVLVSTRIESNRSWGLHWDGLDVVLQKTVTVRGKWRHPKGFKERLFIHIPVDTVSQLQKFNADVVLSAEMGLRTLLSLLYCRLSRGAKLIVWAEISEESEQGRGGLRRALRLMLARHTDAFIVYGDSGARYVRKLNVPDFKIFVVPYSTDVRRFAQCSLERTDHQARRLLYVGQLIDRKGLFPFLAALSRWAIAHPDRLIELSIAGDGPLRDQLERLSTPSNLVLEMLGDLRYEDVPEVYANSGIFVFPTLADTWGLVVNEALASGLPVLGSLYSQAVEMLVEDEQNGWTFHPNGPEQTYNVIDRCLNTSLEKLGEMRSRARTVAVEQTPEYVSNLIDRAVMACVKGIDGRQEVANVG